MPATKRDTKSSARGAPGAGRKKKSGVRRPAMKVKRSAVRAPRYAPAPKGLGKIRVGVIYGKSFDPIQLGTYDRNYPEKMRIKNNTGPNAPGWGGQFQSDVSVGLKIGRLHPDIFDVDIMNIHEVTEARLSRNHITFNFWGDICAALLDGSKELTSRITKIQKDAQFRHHPAWDYYEWVQHKSRYMRQCLKAGIPMIDTIFVDHGFNARKVLKQILARGWKNFLVKPAYVSCFGNGLLHGTTQHFVDNFHLLLEYEKENKKQKEFLVQPYVLKPNGKVFDEVRNFIIDGEWCFSVYTDGTDDDGVYEQPPGALKDACKELSLRVYEEVKKASKWEGVRVDTLLNRVDVGVVPDKSRKEGWRIFVNEVEPEMSTWLGRYCPFDFTDRLGRAAVNTIRKLLRVSLSKGRKMPNGAKLRELLDILDDRLGPTGMH